MDGNENITWSTLTGLEPRLIDLYNYAQTVHDPGGVTFCANEIWYQNIKPQLITMVGWDALTDNEILTSPQAYELAIDVIYNELPACRACGCA